MRVGALVVVVVVVVVAACAAPRAAVESCDDDLSGVWSDGQRRWHALDLRRAVEVYPMFDSAETDQQSAHALMFVRSPEGMRGHHVYWDGNERVRRLATIQCRDGELVIVSARLQLTLAPSK